MPALSDLPRRLDGMGAALAGDSLKRVTGRVAQAAKLDTLDALDMDLPGRKFTNWRPKLGVRYRDTEPGSVTVSAINPGPWLVLDKGRIRGRRATRRGKRRIATWGPTRGRGTWGKALTQVAQNTPQRVRDETLAALRKADQ